MQQNDRVAIVTGASTGIGQASAKALRQARIQGVRHQPASSDA
jgi:NAD(P)-dependent dehydrogenase (short-subunit alcohol dehydrogenase family)